jgi:hypothetical protein
MQHKKVIRILKHVLKSCDFHTIFEENVFKMADINIEMRKNEIGTPPV